MKLAEGLSLRKDMQTRVAQLKERLMNNSKVYEGDEPMEKPEELMKELDRCLNQLEKLIFRINKTNMQVVSPNVLGMIFVSYSCSGCGNYNYWRITLV